jgi:hypothetical protein
MTEPRLAKIECIDDDFDRLFSNLVEEQEPVLPDKITPAELLPPSLREVFNRLSLQDKVWNPGPITVPILKRTLDVPYAFKNGVVNLVQPQVFKTGKRAETDAAKLVIDGDLISKHRIDGVRHKLIVISAQESPEQAKEIDEHIAPLFDEYKVKLVRPQDVDSFAAKVEKSAH